MENYLFNLRIPPKHAADLDPVLALVVLDVFHLRGGGLTDCCNGILHDAFIGKVRVVLV